MILQEYLEDLQRQINGLQKAVEDLQTQEFATGWINWTSSATIVGFSGTPAGSIYYKKVGKLIFVRYSLSGTGNNAAMTFTLPFNKVNDGTTTEWAMARSQDAGSWNSDSMGRITNASRGIAAFYPNNILGSWTASGARQIYGEFFYVAE